MAVSSSCVWEVQTGGSDNNGGGFVTGASGTDYSQQTAAQVTLSTASTVNSTTTIIDVAAGDHTPVAADVGNILQITGGSATAGYYEITASGSGQWTLDRSAGTAGQTVVGSMGGCLATPGELANAMTVHMQTAWIKSGTYTLTTSTPGPGGPVVLGGNTQGFTVSGYQTTRGDGGARAVIDAGAQTGVTLYTDSTSGNSYSVSAYLEADGQSGAGNVGFALTNAGMQLFASKAIDCPGNGVTGNGVAISCEANGCADGFTTHALSCWAENNSDDGYTGSGKIFVNCLATNNGGDGYQYGTGNTYHRCVAEGNTSDGWDGSFARSNVIECVATNNGAYGFRASSSPLNMYGCASYNNTSGRTLASGSGTINDTAGVTLTADPWENAASNDYRPNNTAGGGAELRDGAVGVLNQTDNADLSAVQHADPAGGGGGGVNRLTGRGLAG